MVKRLMLLAAMLTMVLAAAVPALAQDIEPATDIEPGDEDELICLLPEGCDTDAGIEPVHSEVEPVGGDIEPAPGDVEPAPGCPQAVNGSDGSIVPAPEPAEAPDDGSLARAAVPGCFEVFVPATGVSEASEPLYW